jgi:hypothetical protein
MREPYLQRGARDQEAMAAVERAHNLREERCLVLDAVRLVDHHVLPCVFPERALLLDRYLEGG